MSYQAYHSDLAASAYQALNRDDDDRFLSRDFGDFDVSPGERIGPPLRRRYRGLRLVVFMLLLAGGAWGMHASGIDWRGVGQDVIAKLSMPTPQERVPDTKANEPPPVLAPPREIETPTVAGTPVEPQANADATAPTNSISDNEERTEAASPAATEFKQPQLAPNADPVQVKAFAVGLHPDISRAILARLSSEDFRNAGVAIKTALAETADDAFLTWPRSPRTRQAIFKVHFVEGATGDCRRYVVTVTLDNWAATAPPMEKCGVTRARRG